MIGIWYDDGFGFSDLDRIMFWAKFSDQDRIRILLKFFRADWIIKFQYPHNTGMHAQNNILHTKYTDKTDYQGLGIRV